MTTLPPDNRASETTTVDEGLVLYSAPWCSMCRNVRVCLEAAGVHFREVNPEEDEDAARKLATLTGGPLPVPTVQAGGRFLVNPDDSSLAEFLGVEMTDPLSIYDVAFLGAGPAGLTGAIYTAREGLRTVVVEKGIPGGQAALTERIENYPGFPEPIGGVELMERVRRQAEKFGVRVLESTEVLKVEAGAPIIRLITDGPTVSTRSLVITAGSVYRRLGVPGEDKFIGRGVSFCATCDAPFFRGLPVVVVGGGNSALQETVHLAGFASRVTLVQNLDRLTGSKVLEERVRGLPNVEVRLSSRVTGIRGEKTVSEVAVEDTVTGEASVIPAEGVFVFIGLAPNTGIFKGQLELDSQGFIVTDPRTFATSLPGVFAAGDVRSGSSKQITAAVGEGTVASFVVRTWLADRDRCPLSLGRQPPPTNMTDSAI